MDPSLLLIHDDREEDVQLRTALRYAVPRLDIWVARHLDDVRTFPPPKLILLDLDLPQPGALDVLQWLRSGEPYERIPVIVLTSPQGASQVDRALELGANSCLLKPEKGEVLDGVARGIGTYARLLAC